MLASDMKRGGSGGNSESGSFFDGGANPVDIRQHMSAYVSICQHTPAYVTIRQHLNLGPFSMVAQILNTQRHRHTDTEDRYTAAV